MPLEPENRDALADSQARMNNSTRGQWDFFENHRRNLERLIVPEARGGMICVLGAGNCNDLDLKWLAGAYRQVHLVDIDAAALRRAVEKQGVEKLRMEDGGWGVENAAGIALHAPVDLTGISDLVASWKGRSVSEEVVGQAVREVEGGMNDELRDEKLEVRSEKREEKIGKREVRGEKQEKSHNPQLTTDNGPLTTNKPRSVIHSALSTQHSACSSPGAILIGKKAHAACFARDLPVELAGRFDLVLSPCVLSQLWCGVRHVLGARHPGWPGLKEAIRRRHLRMMLKLLRPGGRGVMAVDWASSGKIAGLERAREEDLDGLMRSCAGQGKGFGGLSPLEMAAAVCAAGGGEMEVSRPWIWHLGLKKAFLCYGGAFRRNMSNVKS